MYFITDLFLQNGYQVQQSIHIRRGILITREFIEAEGVSELREGTMKKVMVRGHAILVARVKGQYYAVDARCPHLEGDLSEGTLRDTIITCPMHHSQFDLRDGHVIRWTDLTGITLTIASRQHPPRSLKYYPVRIEGNRILIALG